MEEETDGEAKSLSQIHSVMSQMGSEPRLARPIAPKGSTTYLTGKIQCARRGTGPFLVHWISGQLVSLLSRLWLPSRGGRDSL